MSDIDKLPDPGGPLPLDLQTSEIQLASVIPTTQYVRPCAGIEPETKQWDGVPTLADRFATLTRLLPLAGAEAMKPGANGELAIVAHLRARAPWFANVIDLIEGVGSPGTELEFAL